MRVDLKRTFLVSALAAALAFVAAPLFAAPALAQTLTADAQLYELTENMKLVGGNLVRRKATSQLMGWAKVGKPLCPTELVAAVSPGAEFCTINATGSDNVKLTTLKGTLSGRFTVVVQGDNPVDSPELVVMQGNFRGKIDFGNVASGFGTAEGTFTSDAGQKIPFSGTFRVPYLIFLDVSVVPPTPCDPTTGGPYCVQVTPRPVYTDLSGGNPLGVEVEPDEYSLGYPTVRFEINFP